MLSRDIALSNSLHNLASLSRHAASSSRCLELSASIPLRSASSSPRNSSFSFFSTPHSHSCTSTPSRRATSSTPSPSDIPNEAARVPPPTSPCTSRKCFTKLSFRLKALPRRLQPGMSQYKPKAPCPCTVARCRSRSVFVPNLLVQVPQGKRRSCLARCFLYQLLVTIK